MMAFLRPVQALVLLVVVAICQAQSSLSSCPSTLTASYVAPSVAPGYVARLVANSLTKPRGIKFDSKGALLVVESGLGVTALTFDESNGGCLSVASRKTVVNDTTLNHGIEFSNDGQTLYASSSEAVYAWAYDADRMTNTSVPSILVNNMTGSDHTTRTLLMSKKVDGLLVVTRGSTSNLDIDAESLATGHSQVKAFNLTNQTGPYDFNADGLLLGWGLRNDVGIDEDPVMGGIYTVENSVDEMTRNKIDIHENNPGEELNFLGYLNGTNYDEQGKNFGYPECFAAWNVSAIPNNTGLQVGSQFGIDLPNGTTGLDADAACAQRAAPRLTFQAHMAPLDILFNQNGTAAWVTFHGSWDRTDPVGYKLSLVEFANGQPVQPSNSNTAAIDIVSNADNSKCPEGCFRPVGLAWDSSGRLFMSSDSTGEIYVVLRESGNATDSAGSSQPSSVPSPTTTGASSSTGSSTAATSSGAASEQFHIASSAVGLWTLGWCAVSSLLL